MDFGELRSPVRSTMPVMALDRRHVMWRRVKVPLFVGIGVLILAILGTGAFFVVRSALIRSAVEKAMVSMALDTIDGIHGAVESLEGLAGDHPGRKDVEAALAYALVMEAMRNGPPEPGVARARKALSLSDADGGGPVFHAASILVLVAEGKPDDAVAYSGNLPKETFERDEVKLAKALALAGAGNDLEARVELELMAVEDNPYLPAITVLGQVRQRLGLNDAAVALLRTSLEKNPGRLDAQLTLALALVELGTPEALAEAGRIMGVVEGEIGGAPPHVATRGFYARGLLLSAQGKYGEAVEPLAKAMAGMEGNALVVARCARARRLSGDPLGAFDTLAGLEIGEKTPTIALVEVAESALSLWRPASAAPAIAILEARPDLDAASRSMLVGRVAREAGDHAAAAEAFGGAGRAGGAQLLAALSLVEAGRGKEARGLLKEMGDGPDVACAESLRSWLRGDPGKALSGLEGQAPCAAVLKGRFLFELHRYSEAMPVLEKSLGSDGDPLARVMLALSVYRVSGPGESMAMLDEIAGLHPDSIPLLAALAGAYLEMGRAGEAVEAAEAAVARNAGNPEAVALRARILRMNGDAGNAASAVDEALAEHAQSASLLVEKAWALLDAGSAAEAAAAGQQAMDLGGPRYPDAALVTAAALEAQKDDDGADGVLKKALYEISVNHDPALASPLWTESVRVKRARGGKPNIAKAKASYSQAAKKDFPDAALFHEGALTMIADGKKEDAILLLHGAASTDPAFAPPFAKLKDLEALTDAEIAAYTAVHGSPP